MRELTYETLSEAADARLGEASILYEKGEFHGASLMAYYAVECMVKALIARNSLDRVLKKRFFVHLSGETYDFLLTATGVGPRLRENPAMRDKISALATLSQNQLRYGTEEIDEQEAGQRVKTAKEVVAWLKRQ